jgi:hypothetical protein
MTNDKNVSLNEGLNQYYLRDFESKTNANRYYVLKQLLNGISRSVLHQATEQSVVDAKRVWICYPSLITR